MGTRVSCYISDFRTTACPQIRMCRLIRSASIIGLEIASTQRDQVLGKLIHIEGTRRRSHAGIATLTGNRTILAAAERVPPAPLISVVVPALFVAIPRIDADDPAVPSE